MEARNDTGRILIVEDEIFVALDLESIVEGAGHDVVGIGADRSSALALASECDVALVDVNLRDGATGPEIARDLADRGVRVIFVTANPGQIAHLQGIAMGYVQKPFAPLTVKRAIEVALSGYDQDPAISGFIPLPAASDSGSSPRAG